MPTESPRCTLMFSAQTRSYERKVSEHQDHCTSQSSTLKCSTEIKQNVSTNKSSSQRVYSLLPKYNTPVRKPIKNPFNERILEVFNAPTCSPDFCSTSALPSEPTNKGEFYWTVEDLWRIDPAPIESPQTDVEDNLDDETESMAQEAIERYFQESHNILSPIGSPKPVILYKRGVTPDLPTPKCVSERAMSTPCTRYDSRLIVKKSVASQTMLSLTSDIPDSILELLRPYMNSLDESQQDGNNTSSSNLRRKLFCNELYDSPDNSDNESNKDKKVVSRFLPSDWTPDKVQSTVDLFAKSPDISPIAEKGELHRPCYFNFTREMAIDVTTSPIKGEQCIQNMSIDFNGESTIDTSMIRRRSSQTSADTGYITNASEKSNKSQPIVSSEEQDKNTGRKFTRSYVGVTDASTTQTGLTSTPTSNKHCNKNI